MRAVVLLFLLLTLCAAGSLVAGVYLLVGLGWSLIAASACLAAMAALLRKGMTSG